MLKIDLWNDDTTTLHTITGSPNDVENAVNDLIKQYPSEGYSTFVQKRTNLSDGRVQVILFRFNSCD